MEQETKTIYISPSSKVFPFIITLLAIIGVFVVGELAYKFQTLPQNAPREVYVSGEGKAYGKPDVAIINLGAHTEATKSQDAVNQNNKIMDAVVKSIKELGVEDKDIQTTFYNLTPNYEYEAPALNRELYPPYSGKRIISGYSLDQQIQVKIRNFDKINEILDKATSEGANTVSQLQFTIDDMEKLKSQAREKAINRAKEKANSLLSQAGLRSMQIVNVSEGYMPGPGPFLRQEYAKAADESSVAPQIQTGQLEVYSTVTLTYRVR